MFTIDNILNDRPVSKGAPPQMIRRHMSITGDSIHDDSRKITESSGFSNQILFEGNRLPVRKRYRDEDVFTCKSGNCAELQSPELSANFDRESSIHEQLSNGMSSPSSRSISPASSSDDDVTPTRRKKARTCFTNLQLDGLEAAYLTQHYLPTTERKCLANKLGMADQQVKTWFQNRRMKAKRQGQDPDSRCAVSFPAIPMSTTQHTISQSVPQLNLPTQFTPLSIYPPTIPVSCFPQMSIAGYPHQSGGLLKVAAPFTHTLQTPVCLSGIQQSPPACVTTGRLAFTDGFSPDHYIPRDRKP